MRFLFHVLAIALALWVCTLAFPQGFTVQSPATLAVAALVLGVVNAVVRPLLQIVALPITCLTLGLFYFVINGAAFGLAAYITPGFGVNGFLWAILGALIVSVISGIIGPLARRTREDCPYALGITDWDTLPDGRLAVVAGPDTEHGASELRLVLNWTRGLE